MNTLKSKTVARQINDILNQFKALQVTPGRNAQSEPSPSGEQYCTDCGAGSIKTILITVRRGMVEQVCNLPKNWDYEIVDYDAAENK